jgi:hypothetical protein
MTHKLTLLLALLAACCLTAAAADINGKWVAQVPGRDGQTRETSFEFKAAGESVAGTMSGRQGNQVPISDGKLSGDTLTFVVSMEMGGNPVKWNFTGKVKGEEIQFRREGGMGQPREFVAKRAK